MVDSLQIRASRPGDLPSITILYPDAFPDEDLLPLVSDLLLAGPVALSLVGVIGSSVVGHVVFTRCGVSGSSHEAALLGPLAVASTWQNQGIGSAMVRDGLQRLAKDGIACVYVLGNPAYNKRFGFAREVCVAPPYPLPKDWWGAWQSVRLGKIGCPCRGTLSLQQPWLRPSLWAP